VDGAPRLSALSARAVALRAKRWLDVTLSLALLAVTAPVLLAAALLVRLSGPGPVLFVQKRIGYRGQSFDMYKLRTMVPEAHLLEDELATRSSGKTFLKLERDPRITRVGRLLRRTSLDELPQLLNVLSGDMSLVGPRPLLRCDFAKFPKDQQLRRFAMPPGLTGLWQVSGRSLLSDEDRIRLDLDYVDRWSLLFDLEVLLRTLPAVLSGRGAS
jgi:lipopolysaccharide/colanic/teichoic acid biosynthesis glycosyltransferase